MNIEMYIAGGASGLILALGILGIFMPKTGSSITVFVFIIGLILFCGLFFGIFASIADALNKIARK